MRSNRRSRRTVASLAGFVILGACLSSGAVAPITARAAATTYFLHGKTTPQDDTNRAAGMPSAFFDTTAPSNTTDDVTQTGSIQANANLAANPLSVYWFAPFTGTINGNVHFDWYWSSTNAEAVALGDNITVTFFADATPAANTGTKIGSGTTSIKLGATPVLNHSDIQGISGTAVTNLLIQVTVNFVDSGNANTIHYDSTPTPSSFTIGAASTGATPTFVSDPVNYNAATIVSPTFLGAEPQTTMERTIDVSQLNATDSNRIFIDWPLSTRTQIGQLHRSLDGGDSFRMLYDLSCAIRSRPNCLTGGGGDTVNRVNLYDGTVLYGDQEAVANEALASSIDHGDSFPTTRQFAVSNATLGVDRQWISPVNAPGIMGGTGVGPGIEVRGFYSYHIPAAGEYIQGITTNGVPIAQPVAQLTLVNQSGPSRVDVITKSPGFGYIYQCYRDAGGFEVAVAKISAYQTPSAWTVNTVSTDTATIFPWINLDNQGNLYAVWVTGGKLFYSYSLIHDSANDPTLPTPGKPATKWAPKVQINRPDITSTVFPEVVAGDPGQVAVAYYGTTTFSGQSDGAPATTEWNVYTAVMTNASGINLTGPTIATGQVNHRVAHVGNICTSGTTCTGTSDRSLLDMMDLGFDKDGRVGVVFMDNNNKLAIDTGTPPVKGSPFVHFTKEVLGPSLLHTSAGINLLPNGSGNDPTGDATWPNVSGATNLPGLDETNASIGMDATGNNIVGSITLNQGTTTAMQAALANYNTANGTAGIGNNASRLQYILRFSTATDVYYMSFDIDSSGTPVTHCLGGKLDGTDGLTNGSSTLGAGYHTKAGTTVTCTLSGNTINFSTAANTADFMGVVSGTNVYSVTGFATAGPTEATEATILDTMRVVDATPPFDTILAPGGGIPEFRSVPVLVGTGAAILLIFGIFRRRRTRQYRIA